MRFGTDSSTLHDGNCSFAPSFFYALGELSTSHVFPFPERHVPVGREAFLKVTSGWPPGRRAETKMEDAWPRLPSPLVAAESALGPGSDPASPAEGRRPGLPFLGRFRREARVSQAEARRSSEGPRGAA